MYTVSFDLLSDSPDTATIVIIAIAAIIVLGGLGAVAFKKLERFKRKLDYINMEIKRTEGREQKHWKKKRRKHWLSLLPFTKKH